MTTREAFIERVRRAAEQGGAYRVHLQAVPADIGYLGASEDLVERFAQEAIAVGAHVEVVKDLAKASSRLQSLLADLNASRAVYWEHDLLNSLPMKGVLQARGITASSYEQLASLPQYERRVRWLSCDVGITSCDCAIAETGTLMMQSRPGQERLASLLPPTHIAIIRRSQIVPDLLDAFRLLSAVDLPSNVTFITGPSKTGDIELQLTTGVHGPGRLHILIISE